MTDQNNAGPGEREERENGGNRDHRENRDDMLGQAMDLVKTPFYAWIGAGVRTVEVLGDIGARVRAEEEARDAGEDPRDDADATAAAVDDADSSGDGLAGRVRDARRRVRDLGDSVSEQSRDAFLKAVDAAQEAFNDALTKAQAGGDRAFASAHSLPDDVAAAAEYLKPEQLRSVADIYLESASKLYRELAARGEQAVDEGVSVAKERSSAFTARGRDAGDGAAGDGAKRGTDPVSAFLGRIPFAGSAAGSFEDVARETVKPFQDAGQEFLGRLDQEKLSNRVESILHQAADVTEQLLGALRAEDAANARANGGEPDVVDGDVVDEEPADKPAPAPGEDPTVDVDGSENIAGVAVDAEAADDAADAEETVAGDDATDGPAGA